METSTIIGIITAVGLLYYFIKRKYSYWERNGIPFIKPSIPRGNFSEFGKRHQSFILQEFYNQMKGKGKFFGIYGFHNPIAIPTDLDFIKNIIIKDFTHFQDRGVYTNERDDPLSAHLFAIGGPKWRHLRTKLTPTFTSGKMKFMYPTVVNVADEFKVTINAILGEGGCADVEIKDLLARFTTDVIGECAFGIECNSLKNPNAEFREMGRQIFTVTRSRLLKFSILQAFPKIAKFLRMKLTREEISTFFMGIVSETVSLRENNDIKRNDFMDLLIKLKNNQGFDENGSKLGGISLEELAAQAFVFFLAGFETSSTVMTYALFELAKNQDIQSRARNEIKEVLAKHGGVFSYEAMLDMPYVDQILQESLRMYPPVVTLNRIATKPYRAPGSCFTLEEGTKVWIPIYALHHDPEYFPNPSVFNPDRFTTEEVQKRNNATFLPFGDGPRNCIGLRFGMMQTRVGLVTLLSNYVFSLCDKTTVPLIISAKNFILTAEGGVYLNFRKVSA